MIVNAGYRGKVGASVPKFTYTGTYNVREDGVVELLTSGTLVFLSPSVIDVFCVGGGGAGTTVPYAASYMRGLAGGGGGYTSTKKRISVNGTVAVTIGAGGTNNPQANGGTTSFGDFISADGGVSGGVESAPSSVAGTGKNGGSGGGGGRYSNQSLDGIGGSDGSNGQPENGLSPYIAKGGAGQGTTTREFGESAGKLYAGGGGGGTYLAGSAVTYNIGGAGGGGAGAWVGSGTQAATAGSANTGGGGGGGASGGNRAASGGSGGSGICCFRSAK